MLLVLFPLIGAAIAALGKVVPRARFTRYLGVVALAPAVVVLAVTLRPLYAGGAPAVYAVGGFTMEPGITLMLDGLAWISSALIMVITAIVAVASLPHRRFDATYQFFLLMTAAGMQSVVVTTDLFTMFVSFEIVAIGVYVLIAWERTAQGLLASLKYLFLSSVGILFFLLGVFLVYRDLGTLSLLTITRGASASWTPRVAASAVAALCVGIGVRTAFVPFHTWLPEAHAWAPHPVSALLSGVLIKISFLAMVRIVVAFRAVALQPLFVWLGAITALVAVVWALAQHDAKRLLAFHSISQMGFILAAWGAADALAATAAYGHAVSHALFKALLFLVVGIAIERSGSRDVFRMRGVARGAPLLAVGLVVGAAAISGIPPMNGFVSKRLVSAAMYGSPAYLLLRIAAVGTVASFLKLSRVLLPAPRGEYAVADGRNAADGRQSGGVPTGMRLPVAEGAAVAVLLILVVGTGVVGPQLAGGAARLVGAPAEIPDVYRPSGLVDTVLTVGLGAILAALVLSPPGRRIGERISAVAPQLGTVLVFFVGGLVLFALVPLLAAG